MAEKTIVDCAPRNGHILQDGTSFKAFKINAKRALAFKSSARDPGTLLVEHSTWMCTGCTSITVPCMEKEQILKKSSLP